MTTRHFRTAPTTRLALKATPLLAVAVLTVAGCSNSERSTDAKGTTPAVVSGDQAPNNAAAGDRGSAEDHEGKSEGSAGEATARFKGAGGEDMGTANFVTKGNSVTVKVVASGLPEGFHGMHLHSVGKCESNSTAPTGGAPGAFLSAGGHLQVDGSESHPSSGDLVSIFIKADGTGETTTSTDAFTLSQITGKSIIIHEKPDNFGNIPERYGKAPDSETLMTGDAGKRLACGVIAKS